MVTRRRRNGKRENRILNRKPLRSEISSALEEEKDTKSVHVYGPLCDLRANHSRQKAETHSVGSGVGMYGQSGRPHNVSRRETVGKRERVRERERESARR